MKKIYTLLILLLFISRLLAQNNDSEINIGINHTITSSILNEDRIIQIYTPEDYSESNKEYPVLYILDGQRFFGYVVGLNNTFKQFKLSPEFIIVGINTSYPQRFRNFSNNADKFIEFMKTELLPYIENNYPVNNEKILFGWEYAGSLGFNIMLNNVIPFNSYLLASPFPIQNKIDDLDSVSKMNTMLKFSVSPDEYEVNHGTDKLDSLLSSKKIKELNWSYLQLKNEEHRSTGYPTLYHGLRTYFKYYPEFQEDNLEKFIEAGGLNYAYTYARERGRKYGFNPILSTWTKYTIIRSAIRANNYDYFKTYVNEFLTDEFIADLKNRAIDIAMFYEKNKNYKKAIEIYKTMLVKLPDSKELLEKIGNAYLSLDNTNEAEKYFQRVKDIIKNEK